LSLPLIRSQPAQVEPDRIVAGTIFSQRGGDGPGVGLIGQYPGENGLKLVQMRFREGVRAEGSTSDHLLFVNLGEKHQISCRLNHWSSHHEEQTGDLAICPAGCDFEASADSSVNVLLCAVPKDLLSFYLAEYAVPRANLLQHLNGHDEQLNRALFDLAHEIQTGFCGGAVHWNDLTETLLGRLVQDHIVGGGGAGRGVLSPEHMARINGYVAENLGEAINVDAIADLVVRGRSQFPKTFRRSVGMSPYQYIVRLRLKFALEMMRRGEMTLAEVAAATGFTDQSHFTHWVKRIYGVTPLKWAYAVR